MTLLHRFRSWLRAMLHRSRAEREMDSELRFHVDAYTEDLICKGVARDEALRRALVEFGGLEQAKEECRDARGTHLVDSLLQDLRYGVRILCASPRFGIAAIFTIALGVGANAAIYGLIDSAFLRSLPFHDPNRLVHIWTIEADGEAHTPTTLQYQAIVEERPRAFEQVAASGWTSFFYGADGWLLQPLRGSLVTPSWLPTLGIRPILGRNFREHEQIAGQDTVAILSYTCWHTRFHGDPQVIGKQIVLDRRLVTVIGVLPQSLMPYYPDTDIYAPLVLGSYANHGYVRAGKMRVQIVARLKLGATLAEAGSEAEVIAGQLKDPAAPANRPEKLVVQDFTELLRHSGPTEQNARHGLWMTAVAAGIVLLIACANVASLLLARGVKRHREIAIRMALGCSRGRMIRQLLTENMLLFFFGGAAAVVATRWCSEAVTQVASGIMPGAYLEVDGGVFAATLGISFLCSLAFGMIPALQATRTNPDESLKDRASNAPGGTRTRRWRNTLVAGQVALGMMLLVVFGLLIRSFVNVRSSPLGYDAHNVLTATVHLPATRYTEPSDKERLLREAVDQMRRMPGVESVGIADALPMEGADSSQIKIEAPSAGAAPRETELWFVSVSPDYFSTMRIPMVAGRPFQQTDSLTGGEVAIVNQSFAKQYFPGANPIGYHLAFAGFPPGWKQIVGVVSDFRQRNPEEDLRPLAYFPIAQMSPPRWSLVIRVHPTGDLGELAARAGAWLRPVDPEVYWEIRDMGRLFQDSESVTMRRPILALLGCFGGLSMLLVVVGVYGVTSYSVVERTKEIGIRVALGASNREVAGLLLGESLSVALLGLTVGAVWAFAMAHFLPTSGIGWSGSGLFLCNVSRADGFTYVAAALLLVSVVCVASWLPTERAARVDPIVALRYE